MRECVHEHDKPCSMGQYCECNFIDQEHAFVGVAFVMPELNSDETGMCILCLRKLTQLLFYRVQKAGFTSSQLIQTYGNICDPPESTTLARCSSCHRTGRCTACLYQSRRTSATSTMS
jgi:hypothetical protein